MCLLALLIDNVKQHLVCFTQASETHHVERLAS